MSNKQHLTKLSDLEFVEELSALEVGTVVGGDSLPSADELIEKVNDLVLKRRRSAEKAFVEKFPKFVSEAIFGEDGPDSLDQ